MFSWRNENSVEYLKSSIAQYEKDIKNIEAYDKNLEIQYKKERENLELQYNKERENVQIHLKNLKAECQVLKDKLEAKLTRVKEDPMVSFKKDCMERAKEYGSEELIEVIFKQFEDTMKELKQVPYLNISFTRNLNDDGFSFKYSVKDYTKLTDEVRNKIKKCLRLYGMLYN